MNRPLIGVVVGPTVAAILLVSACYIVLPTERALVLQFGNPVRVDASPGFYFKDVVFFDGRVLNFDPPSEEVPTVDLKQVDVSAFAVYRIVNPLLFYQTINNEAGVQGRLGAIIERQPASGPGQCLHGRDPDPAAGSVHAGDRPPVNLDTRSFGMRSSTSA
jgi:membrane protease subunit HflC